jgi:hypothetical protein
MTPVETTMPAVPTPGEDLFRALIRDLVRGSIPDIARILRSSAFDGAAFAAFAKREGLAGLAHALLRRSAPAAALAPDAAHDLRAAHLRQWARSREFLAEMTMIAQWLRPHAPDLVFLKGPLLARRLYGDLGTREIADVDLLVRGSEVEPVEHALIARGYERVSAVPITKSIARAFTHHFGYRRERVLVEVHWVLQRHAGLRIDHDALRARSDSVDVEGTTFRAAALVDELVLQTLSTFTDLQLGVARLRSVVDQYALLRRLDPEVSWGASRSPSWGSSSTCSIAQRSFPRSPLSSSSAVVKHTSHGSRRTEARCGLTQATSVSVSAGCGCATYRSPWRSDGGRSRSRLDWRSIDPSDRDASADSSREADHPPALRAVPRTR